jgi:general nucleoside transport system permease protein
VTALLFAALRQATPLALAALGGVISERAGVINIALEGMMLTGAFVGVWAGQSYGPVAGLVAAIVAGAAAGLFHLLLVTRLRMNHIISGVAINLLALNATTYLLRALFVQADPPRQAYLAERLPMTWFIAAAVLLPICAQFGLFRTVLGLRLRAVGESPESARLAGIAAGPLRVAALAASGALAGAGGAFLSMALVGRFSQDMVSGRGFIALAAVICGRWRPVQAAVAALAFGLLDALQIQLQGTVAVPTELLQAAPYVFTVLAALAARPVPPAALGQTISTRIA